MIISIFYGFYEEKNDSLTFSMNSNTNVYFVAQCYDSCLRNANSNACKCLQLLIMGIIIMLMGHGAWGVLREKPDNYFKQAVSLAVTEECWEIASHLGLGFGYTHTHRER